MAADRAGVAIGEQQSRAARILLLERHHPRRAAREPQRGLEGLGEALRGVGTQPQAVDHRIDAVLAPCIELRRGIEFMHLAVDAGAHEALRLQIAQGGLVAALAILHQGCKQQHGGTLGHLQHLVHHLAHGLRLERQTVVGAVRYSRPRVQQTQVVVDLGDGADGGARVVGRRLLLDGDGGREPLDVVHIGFVHHGEELPGIGRQRLDVTALALGIEGIEGERGLART